MQEQSSQWPRRKRRKKTRRNVTGGHRPHQGDVQQHDRHDHRHQGRHALLGQRRHQSASRAAARARRSPASWPPQQAAEKAAKFGVKEVEVRVKGPGSGRESAITALQAAGLTIKSIEDVTPLPHNGCRPPQEAPRVIATSSQPRPARSRLSITEHSDPAEPDTDMARYTGPVCRLCRRDGMKLFLKGTRCDTPKCAIERREAPPGMHAVPPRQADRLRRPPAREAEGQALLRRARAAVPPLLRSRPRRAKGNTGDALMSLLERRLDNVVHRLGFGQSRAQARQLVAHGHITVNGRRVDIPSYLVQRRRRDPRQEPRQEPRLGPAATWPRAHRDVPDFLSLIDARDSRRPRRAACPRPTTFRSPFRPS